MTKARQDQVDLESTPYYHCYVRCVRRAYLCGEDFSTGENFDHRKQWIVSRLKFLSYVFSIDICAYAVMSNHYHVVLHVDKARALSWSREEVVERWMQLYNGDVLVDKWLAKPDLLSRPALEAVYERIELWRERLYGLDWFMRCVNETIARMANEEENCKGRFWEGRYKSQALLDETALLSCMAYVDLNPVRAAMADSLETSDFTSIQSRIAEFGKKRLEAIPGAPTEQDATKPVNSKPVNSKQAPLAPKTAIKTAQQRINQQLSIERELKLDNLPKASLKPFDGSSHTSINHALPFTLEDYFQLVDETGRQIREDKRGFTGSSVPSLITSLNIYPNEWLEHIRCFSRRYSSQVGTVELLTRQAILQNKSWVKGVGIARRLESYL